MLFTENLEHLLLHRGFFCNGVVLFHWRIKEVADKILWVGGIFRLGNALGELSVTNNLYRSLRPYTLYTAVVVGPYEKGCCDQLNTAHAKPVQDIFQNQPLRIDRHILSVHTALA